LLSAVPNSPSALKLVARPRQHATVFASNSARRFSPSHTKRRPEIVINGARQSPCVCRRKIARRAAEPRSKNLDRTRRRSGLRTVIRSCLISAWESSRPTCAWSLNCYPPFVQEKSGLFLMSAVPQRRPSSRRARIECS
jgi:hypothetical protein